MADNSKKTARYSAPALGRADALATASLSDAGSLNRPRQSLVLLRRSQGPISCALRPGRSAWALLVDRAAEEIRVGDAEGGGGGGGQWALFSNGGQKRRHAEINVVCVCVCACWQACACACVRGPASGVRPKIRARKMKFVTWWWVWMKRVQSREAGESLGTRIVTCQRRAARRMAAAGWPAVVLQARVSQRWGMDMNGDALVRAAAAAAAVVVDVPEEPSVIEIAVSSTPGRLQNARARGGGWGRYPEVLREADVSAVVFAHSAAATTLRHDYYTCEAILVVVVVVVGVGMGRAKVFSWPAAVMPTDAFEMARHTRCSTQTHSPLCRAARAFTTLAACAFLRRTLPGLHTHRRHGSSPQAALPHPHPHPLPLPPFSYPPLLAAPPPPSGDTTQIDADRWVGTDGRAHVHRQGLQTCGCATAGGRTCSCSWCAAWQPASPRVAASKR